MTQSPLLQNRKTLNRIKNAASRAGLSLAVVPLVVAVLAGHSGFAGHSGRPAHPRHGVVTGVLELFGGPAPGRGFPRQGFVTAHRRGRPAVTVRTGEHGRFRLVLAPGRYTLTGRPDHVRMGCIGHPVTVRAGKTVKDNVICPVP